MFDTWFTKVNMEMMLNEFIQIICQPIDAETIFKIRLGCSGYNMIYSNLHNVTYDPWHNQIIRHS